TATILSSGGIGLAIGGPGAVVAAVVAWVVGSRRPRVRGADDTRRARPRILVPALVGLLFGACMVVVPRLEEAQFDADAITVVLGAFFGLLGGVAVGVFSLNDGPLVATPKPATARDCLFGAVAGIATGIPYGLAEGPGRG